MFVHRGESGSAFLSFLGGMEDPDLNETQRRAVDAVYPHISRALRLHARLDQQQRQTALAESAFDALAAPVFLLDESRALLLANSAGQGLMAVDGLTPQACADARRVAISTIRSQIKAIGKKLGTTRLTQIVQMALRVCC